MNKFGKVPGGHTWWRETLVEGGRVVLTDDSGERCYLDVKRTAVVYDGEIDRALYIPVFDNTGRETSTVSPLAAIAFLSAMGVSTTLVCNNGGRYIIKLQATG